MTLQQLKYVITIADNHSICEAAKVLFITQPSLSNAIKELEKEIGICIFLRNNKGITVTSEGMEFIGYARQIIEQTALLEDKYLGTKQQKVRFSVSTQHYSFAVNAFVELIREFGIEQYDFCLKEVRTYEIIEDVKNMNSEIGILYMTDFNSKIISKLLKESELEFSRLFTAKPHIFIGLKNPLAKKSKVLLEDVVDYPYLSFEQGNFNSFYFSEEILSTLVHKKSIKVSDRATLFNLLIGLNGFTISTGIISKELNGENIISIPLEVDEEIQVGYVVRKDVTTSRLGQLYIEKLKQEVESQ